jgi:hypothetical protein
MDVTRSDIGTAREDVEFANRERNRWGMLVGALEGAKEQLRRGIDDNPGMEALTRFGRILRGDPETSTSERQKELSYLSWETIREGAGKKSTFLAHLGTYSWMESFSKQFRSYVADESGAPADVLAVFDSDALSEAVSKYDTTPSKVDDLIEVAEAGREAAKAHREDAIERLNNEFGEDGTRVASGLVQSFHESASTLGSDEATEAIVDAAEEYDSDELTEYETLVRTLDDLPVAMLPVGMETRFVPESDERTGDGLELWLRVYPDDVHVDAHESALTPQEERWGQTFWTQVFVSRFPTEAPSMRSGPPKEWFLIDPEPKLPDGEFYRDVLANLCFETEEGTTLADFDQHTETRLQEIKERAWGTLCERAGRERAAYVAHETAPLDHSEEDERETAVSVLTEPVPESNVRDGEIDPLEFPDVEYRPASWTKQPRARWLPDRWIATLEWTDDTGTGRSATVAARNAIREPLYLGPNPEAVASSGGDGEDSTDPTSTRDAVDDGLEWMVEFGAAEKAGMGFRVTADDLGTDAVPPEFDRVSVFGLKTSLGPEEGSDALSELFEVHHYTRGLELLPEGAQTNNHEDSSGYRRNEDHVESMPTEVGGPLTGPGDLTDGNLLAELLGIGAEDGESHPFAHVEGADRTDWFESYNVQSTLWAGTLGNYLKQMLLPERALDGNHTDAEREQYERLLATVREHYLRYVRGGGPLPALRIGEQPYGVLPATAIAAHQESGTGDEQSVYRFLLDAVTLLRRLWEGSMGNVPRVGRNRSGPSDTGSEKSALERVLETDAVSNAYHRRLQFVDQGTRGRDYDVRSKKYADFGIGSRPRILRMEHADAPRDVENRTLVANRGHWRPVPAVAARSETYLDHLSRLSTGDLVRSGYDYYTGRLHTFGAIYDANGPIDQWDHLSGLFEGIRDALYAWDDDGTKPSQVTRLQALFCPATDETDFLSIAGVPKSVADDELGLDLGDYDKNADAVALLYVDALDEWLGRLPDDERREVPLEQFSGGAFGSSEPETADINTSAQDGHERAVPALEELQEAIRGHVKLKAKSMQSDWGPGMGELRQLWEAITQGVAMNYEGTIRVGTDYSIEWERMLSGAALSGSGAFVEQGGVFDLDPSEGNLSGDMLEAAEKFNETLFELSWAAMESLITNYTVDYLTLAFLFESRSSGDPVREWDSFRDAGADAIVRGGTPLETKLDRDLSLFGTLSWFSAVNENLDALRRMDGRYGPESHAFGDQRGRDYTAYELFDRSTPESAKRNFGWEADADPDHDLATEFGADRWFGLLDAMRSDRYVGHDGTDDRFAAFHASLRWLNDADLLDRTEEFERAISSTLDVSSHRLDAWWTSLATRRLDGIRSGGDAGTDGLMTPGLADAWVDTADGSTPSYEFDPEELDLAEADGDGGTYLGAYGFVEDLAYEDRNGSRESFEFVQAPSVSHARTAAILQSGYHSNPDEQFQEKMQVDLSPKRVSNAQTVLRGLREGLWLGEILGYFVERRIHEVSQDRAQVNLDRHVSTFRSQYPLVEGKVRDIDPGDGGRAKDVTDGYALYRTLLNEGVEAVVSSLGVSGPDRDAAIRIFEELDEVVDAVADLLTAENVHQLQQGNYSQAGRSISALAEGKIPREPEVTKTIRDTTGVTHRLLALTGLGDEGTGADLRPPTPWQTTGTIETPEVAEDGSLSIDEDTGKPVESEAQFVVRGDAAPVVNELAGRLFPDPGNVHCVATYEWETNSDENPTDHSVSRGVTLSDLKLSPLDALYLTQRSGGAAGSKLESHVAYHVLRDRPTSSPPIPRDADVEVDFERRPAGADDADLTFGEFVELSRSLRDLVGEGRPADATDFAHPGDGAGPQAVTSHLSGRAEDARGGLENVEAVLDNRLRTFGSGGEGTGSLKNSPFADTTARVQRIQDALSAFADDGFVASADEIADAVDGRTFLDELRAIQDRLPAGPTDPAAIDREVVVEPGTATVEGTIPVASEEVDVYLPPERIEMSGHHDGNRVAVWIRGREGDDLIETAATERGNDWDATFDASELVGPGVPVRVVEVEVTARDGAVTGFDGAGALEDPLETEFTAAVVPRALLEPLRAGSFELSVSVESQSAAARVSRTASGVGVDESGRYEATVDLAGAVPGTPFQVVVAAETHGTAPDVEPDPATGVESNDDGERIVLETKTGRVVGSPSEEFDREFLESLSVVPRVLWLTGNADAYRMDTTEDPMRRLSDATVAADWRSIRHEFELMPETRTTFDAAERDAVEALIGLSSVDFGAIEAAVNGFPTNGVGGIATMAEVLFLPKAITLVGTDHPYGSEQTVYPAAGPEGLAEARAQIRGFRRNPYSEASWYVPEQLLRVNSELVEFVEREQVGFPFLYLLALVSDPAWNARTLSLVTDAPGELIRGVDDALHHPEEISPAEYRATMAHLEAAAASARSADEQSVIDRLEAFEYVDDHESDFAPVATLARTLRKFTPSERTPEPERERFVEDFDDAASTLGDNLRPVVTADGSHDVADAFREGTMETLRRVMVRAAYFGVYGAMPDAAAGDSKTVARNLVRQGEDVLKRVRERLTAEAAARDDATDPVERVEARLSALFDDDFQVLPPFEPTNPREIGRTFGDDGLTRVNEAGPLPVETWLARSARVREKVRMFRETLTYADAVNGTDLLALDVGQFPYYPGDDWVGIDGVSPAESDRVSVVGHAGDEFLPTVKGTNGNETPRVAGLFVDEWNEEVPAESETTGVAFRYDDPGNRPPQSILLGVPPKRPKGGSDAGGPWTIDALDSTIEETAEMAKYRAVDLPALDPGGEASAERIVAAQLFPALLFPQDTHVASNHPEVDLTVLERFRQELKSTDLGNLSFGSMSFEGIDPTTVGTLGNVDYGGGN